MRNFLSCSADVCCSRISSSLQWYIDVASSILARRSHDILYDITHFLNANFVISWQRKNLRKVRNRTDLRFGENSRRWKQTTMATGNKNYIINFACHPPDDKQIKLQLMLQIYTYIYIYLHRIKYLIKYRWSRELLLIEKIVNRQLFIENNRISFVSIARFEV
jgi:hypothetical protein